MRREKWSKLRVMMGLVLFLGVSIIVVRKARAVEATPLPQSPSSPAHSSFTYHSMDSNYKFCTAIAATDLNNDGWLDVVSSSEDGTGSIDSWLNAGSGTLTTGAALSTGKNGATTLFGRDLDGDGRTDVALVSHRYGTSAVLKQTSAGSWTRHNLMPTGSYLPISLGTVEVKISGDSYLLIGVSGSGSGTYLAPFPRENKLTMLVSSSDNYPLAVYPDDIDRDGDIDSVVADFYRNGISWYENAAGGATLTHAVAQAFFRTVWLRPADLDRDGDPDIVAASDTHGLAWWANNGTGTGWTQYTITKHEFYRGNNLALGDLDADGDLDIVAGTDRQLVWLENLGHPQAGVHNWVWHVVDTSPYGGGYVVDVGDIDRDGRLDIVSCDLEVKLGNATTTGRRLGWWESKYTPPPASEISFTAHDIDTTLSGAWGVDIADFNGDGILDVAASGYGAGGVSGETRLYKSVPGTTWTWSRLFTASFDKGRGLIAYPRGKTYQLGNGHPAFVVSGDANSGQARAFWSDDWNWNSSSYQAARLTGLGTTYQAAVGDLNNDGVLDVVGTSASKNDIVWWNGKTGIQTVIDDNCAGARAVCLGDIDGDGLMDVGAACTNEEHLIYLRQTGNPVAPWDPISGAVWFGNATDIACGDLNGDGRADLVAARPGNPVGSQGWIGVMGYTSTGGGGGTFTWQWVTTSFTGVEHLALDDIDRDGDLDVAATSASLGKVAWFENQGGVGNFTQYIIDESIGNVREIALGDINGDGAPDMVIALQDLKRVRWYEQQIATELSVDKHVDSTQCTGVISTGQSIPYIVEVTNNSVAANVMVIDRWQPPDAIIDAGSSEDCVTDLGHGVMTCTLFLPAGRIEDLDMVITPTLNFNGYITNTAQVLPTGPFWNLTSYNDTDAAAPVEVQQNVHIWDGLARFGNLPAEPLLPGSTFTYIIGVVNTGPKSGVNATMSNDWSPTSAIAGMTILGGGSSSSALTALADYDCTIDPDPWNITCDMNLAANTPITLTIAITTSSQFTNLLEANLNLIGPDGDEGNPANNQTYPVQVGSRPFEKIYLPILLRNY